MSEDKWNLFDVNNFLKARRILNWMVSVWIILTFFDLKFSELWIYNLLFPDCNGPSNFKIEIVLGILLGYYCIRYYQFLKEELKKLYTNPREKPMAYLTEESLKRTIQIIFIKKYQAPLSKQKLKTNFPKLQ